MNRWINDHNTDSEHRYFHLNLAGKVAPYLLMLIHNVCMLHGTTANGINVNFLGHLSIPTYY